MSVSVPNALSLATIPDGSAIVASDHRNNYSAVQVGVNGLIAMYTVAATKGDLVVSAGGGSFDRLGVGTNGQSIVADSSQTLGMKWAAAGGAMTLIDDLVVTGSVLASYDTNTRLGGSIPGTYKHLKLVGQMRGDSTGAQCTMKVNNDGTSGNYSSAVRIFSSGSGVTGDSLAGSAAGGVIVGDVTLGADTAGRTTSFELLIPDYASTTFHKTWQGQHFNGAAGRLLSIGGEWLSASAITRLALALNAGNFAIGSRFSLYGIS